MRCVRVKDSPEWLRHPGLRLIGLEEACQATVTTVTVIIVVYQEETNATLRHDLCLYVNNTLYYYLHSDFEI